jgi:formylglycine-generating enzyme required for sulfatase activity
MSSPEGVGDTDEHPVHEVTLSACWIDRTEVTVKAYAGNAWEWTRDSYGPYTAAAAVNPRDALAGTARVIRSDAWSTYDAALVGAADRSGVDASLRINFVGFRCARGD